MMRKMCGLILSPTRGPYPLGASGTKMWVQSCCSYALVAGDCVCNEKVKFGACFWSSWPSLLHFPRACVDLLLYSKTDGLFQLWHWNDQVSTDLVGVLARRPLSLLPLDESNVLFLLRNELAHILVLSSPTLGKYVPAPTCPASVLTEGSTVRRTFS